MREFIREDVKLLKEVVLDTVDKLRRSDTFKRVTYKSINPKMSVHCVYTERHTNTDTSLIYKDVNFASCAEGLSKGRIGGYVHLLPVYLSCYATLQYHYWCARTC